jgi:hypothetical protein
MRSPPSSIRAGDPSASIPSRAAPIVAVIVAAALVASASSGSPLVSFWEAGRANRVLLFLDVLPVLAVGIAGMVAYAAFAARKGREGTAVAVKADSFRARLREALPVAAIGTTTATLALFSAGGFPPPQPTTAQGVLEVPGVGFFRTPWGMSHWFEMGGVAKEGADAAERRVVPGTHGAGSGISLRTGLLLLAGAMGVGALWSWYRRKQKPLEADTKAPQGDRAAMEGAIHGSIEAMLADPDPNTAIRGAYARLLMALDSCGRGRWEHEGPMEHLKRVLGTLQIRPTPLRELIALFELARFSPHHLTTTHRDRALLALREVATGLETGP